MCSPPQVPTLGRMMEEFLLFDLERSADQQSGALLLQEVQIHTHCSWSLLHSSTTTHTALKKVFF